MTAKKTMEKIMEIYKIMTNFPITTTISKTEVSRERAQFRDNPPLLVGGWTDGYQKVKNPASTMTVMKTTISTKERDRLWAAPTLPQWDQS